MVLSIFRMMESTSGSILIDGVDISTIPRQEIRSKLICVPQDAYLLFGTVRFNLDPHGLASDEMIEETLRKVQLWDTIESKGGLDAEVDEKFLSHGQKQLFCLGRAILRQGQIVILDESTSRLVFRAATFSAQICSRLISGIVWTRILMLSCNN